MRIERRDILPGLVGLAGAGLLLFLMVKGLTSKRPTLRTGYRRMSGRVYREENTYASKAKARKLADQHRRGGRRARVIQRTKGGPYTVWVRVRA